MKYPVGIQDFKTVRENDYFYADKSALLYKLVKGGQFYFLSRPRRFGKSLLISMMECYFQGERNLFRLVSEVPAGFSKSESSCSPN